MANKSVGDKLLDTGSRREGHRAVQVRRGLPRRRHVVLQAPLEPHAARARHAARHERRARDARRQGDPHRGRHARCGHWRHAWRKRAGDRAGGTRFDERAALRGRADSGGRRRRRAHRGGSDRTDRHRIRAAALRRRSDRKPPAERSERADAGQRLGPSAAHASPASGRRSGCAPPRRRRRRPRRRSRS